MALLGKNFKRDELPQSQSFEPLPAGWYSASIQEAEVKQNNAGTGEYIKVKYQVTGPTHQGRMVFQNINFRHQNETAERIGLQQLHSIMSAIGLNDIEDTDQLIGGALEIKLAKTSSEKYGDGNEVKACKAIEGSAAPKPDFVNTAPAATPATPATPAAPPWAR